MRYRCFFLFALCFPSLFLPAQQPFLSNYQIGDGLSSNYIYSVFQDSKGYIWSSSDVGVCRFDGQSFTQFNTSHGTPDNEIFSICEDHAGRIWFNTLNGKIGFFQNGVFYNENNLPLLKKCDVKGLIVKALELKDGSMVFIGMFKTILLNLERQTVEERLTDKSIVVAWQMPDGKLYGAGKFMGEIAPEGFRPIAEMPTLTQTIQSDLSGDTVLISSGKMLYFLNGQDGRLIGSLSPVEEGNQIIFIRKFGGKLWLGTRDGAICLSYPGLKREHTFLKGHAVSHIMSDREGGLWFSTFEEGLFYAPDPSIMHYTQADGLPHKRVLCLSRDVQKRLWIGSENSSYSILDGNGLENHVIFQKNVINKNTRNIRHLSNGATLVISKAGTLILQNGRSKLLVQRASDVNVDYRGVYWAGLNGIFEISPELVTLKSVPASRPLDIPDSHRFYTIPAISRLRGFKVERIDMDDLKNVWIGTHNGLYRIDSSGNETRVLPHSVRDMEFDPERRQLWVLSESRGLFLIRDAQICDSVALNNQNGQTICSDICLDERGEVWIGAVNGIFRVQGQCGNLRMNNFRGLLGSGGEKINAVEVIGEQVFIGNDDGLLSAPLGVILQSPPSPLPLIKSVSLNGNPLPFDKTFDFDYGPGPLSIGFEGLSFREPQHIHYRYRLEGLDTLWRETSSEALEFAGLRPGNYRFEVFTINGAGEKSSSAATLQFRVKPPFWMQAWFRTLVALAIILLIFWWVKRRERRLREAYEVERKWMESRREKAELQRKNTDLKMLALRLQMNPHFIFNALNTIKGYYGQEKVVEANAFIGKFARLLRLNLDYSDAMIPLDQELELLKIYLQLSQIRYPDKISFELTVAPEIHPMETMIPSMLLQPFVENAVIHGVAPKKSPGEIKVHFSLSGTEIVAIIRDTGVGRDASSRLKLKSDHRPLATYITKERLQLLRPADAAEPALQIRDLFDSRGKAAGTEVEIRLPFQYNRPTTDDQSHSY